MRAAAASFLVCVLCCSAGGCKRYVSVPVRVEDAETGAAIKGALVESKYVMRGLKLIDFVPFGTQMRELRRSACTSDDEGMATVKLTADADTYFQGVSAKAAGYLEPYPAPVSKEVLRQLRASPRRSAEDEVKPVGRIRMLAEPPPRVVLVLPDGHRGIIRVVSRLSSMPAVPGQRIFPRAISPDE